VCNAGRQGLGRRCKVPPSSVDFSVPITVTARSSPGQTLESWAPMLLKVWMSVSILFLCCMNR
jgi:hypothetical protein